MYFSFPEGGPMEKENRVHETQTPSPYLAVLKIDVEICGI
jgi:hypothetical protein